MSYGKFFASTFTGSMAGAGANVFSVWGYCLANGAGGQVSLNPMVVAACIGCDQQEVVSAIEFLASPDPNSRSKSHDGRRIVQLTGVVYEIINHAVYRGLANQESVREYHREKKQAHRLSRTVRENSVSVSVSGSDLDPDLGAQGMPSVWWTLKGWVMSDELRAEAVIAGVPAGELDQRVKELGTGPIGGRRGVFDRDDYVRQQFGKWRMWSEADRAKATQAASQARGYVRKGSPASLEPGPRHVAYAAKHGLALPPIIQALEQDGVVDSLGRRGALEELQKRLIKAAKEKACQISQP
jgi:hypothetical protein